MATAGGSTKSCAICGTDVAGKPRVKDPKGHYYCQPCHTEAMMRRHGAQTRPSRSAPPSADDGLIGFDPD